jgi:hypothetical protein
MNNVKGYLVGLKQSIFHRGETMALEGGISFGPGMGDPKGNFYNPQLSFYWEQPDSVLLEEDSGGENGLLRGWFSKWVN